MIKNVDDYFAEGCGRCERFHTPECSTQTWRKGLARLRSICLDAGLVETVKWGHPCYIFAGRNIAIIGALRGDFRLSFFNAALMQDPQKLLEKQGPNTRHPDMIRFRDDSQVDDLKAVILAYLKEAASYAEQGLKPPKVSSDIELPIELKEAFVADPELASAFEALTRGRQRSYVINLNGAKRSETRVARIGKFRDKIIAGKGATER
ncbi:MAG: YdeI/OmpD-associated family protein [Myxococcota bacterium]